MKNTISKMSVLVEGKAFNLCLDKDGFYFESDLYEFLKSNLFKKLNIPFDSRGKIEELLNLNSLMFKSMPKKSNIALDILKQIEEAQNIKNKKGFIYLVTDGEFTKIGGTSYNPSKRLLELQTGNARKLNLIGYYPCNYVNITEKTIHKDYKDSNELNEWFRLNTDDVVKILEDKFSYSYIRNNENLSHLSVVSIMQCQKEMILSELEIQGKKLKRSLNKVDKTYLYLLKDSKYKKFKPEFLEKVIEKRSKKNVFELYVQINEIDKKGIEYAYMSDSFKSISSDLIRFINDNKICFDDDNELWCKDDDELTPLAFNIKDI